MSARTLLRMRTTARSSGFTFKFQKLRENSSPKSNANPLNHTPRRHISSISRLPLELSCLGSMMPLHSAIASARLNSILSAESQSWGLIPQGISMPL